MNAPTMQAPITIDRDVPLPPKGKAAGRARIYPLPEMEVGDSFACPYDRRGPVCSSVSRVSKSHGFRFETRKIGDQVRVWRVS